MKMSPLCQLQMTLPGGFPGVLGVTVRLMSDGELSRLEVLRDLDQGRLTRLQQCHRKREAGAIGYDSDFQC
jgi:hypothetical protein